MTEVTTLPTRLTVQQAWDQYQRMAIAYAENEALRVDLEFCQRMQRAFKRWSDLFLAMDAAA